MDLTLGTARRSRYRVDGKLDVPDIGWMEVHEILHPTAAGYEDHRYE